MSSARLAARIEAPRFVCAATLPGWRLAFNKPGSDGSGKANLLPARDAAAFGVVWQIAETDWPHLDDLEPGYAREPLDVQAEAGELLRVQLYLHPTRGEDLTPHAWYVEHLRDGAIEHGLPDALVADLDALLRR